MQYEHKFPAGHTVWVAYDKEVLTPDPKRRTRTYYKSITLEPEELIAKGWAHYKS